MRKKAGSDDQVPALVESAVSSTVFRRNWARLIQKIYQIDPLLCPRCQGAMKVISFIEDDALIKRILAHLRLWDTINNDPPQSNEVHIPTFETELTYDYTYWQLPPIDYGPIGLTHNCAFGIFGGVKSNFLSFESLDTKKCNFFCANP